MKTYTIIHVAPEELAPLPYAVVIADSSQCGRVAARADGDLSWLRVGAEVVLLADERFGMRCDSAGEESRPDGKLEPAAWGRARR